MDIPQGVSLQESPTLGRPIIGIIHRPLGDMGNPVVKPVSETARIDSLMLEVLNLKGEIVSIKTLLSTPWWARLWEWFKNL